MIDFLTDSSGVVFRGSWCREDPDDTAASTRVGTKQLSPNMGTRAGLEQSPTFSQAVLDRFPDVLVRVFGHCSSQENHDGGPGQLQPLDNHHGLAGMAGSLSH
jgi:hypothetical protein